MLADAMTRSVVAGATERESVPRLFGDRIVDRPLAPPRPVCEFLRVLLLLRTMLPHAVREQDFRMIRVLSVRQWRRRYTPTTRTRIFGFQHRPSMERASASIGDVRRDAQYLARRRMIEPVDRNRRCARRLKKHMKRNPGTACTFRATTVGNPSSEVFRCIHWCRQFHRGRFRILRAPPRLPDETVRKCLDRRVPSTTLPTADVDETQRGAIRLAQHDHRRSRTTGRVDSNLGVWRRIDFVPSRQDIEHVLQETTRVIDGCVRWHREPLFQSFIGPTPSDRSARQSNARLHGRHLLQVHRQLPQPVHHLSFRRAATLKSHTQRTTWAPIVAGSAPGRTARPAVERGRCRRQITGQERQPVSIGQAE